MLDGLQSAAQHIEIMVDLNADGVAQQVGLPVDDLGLRLVYSNPASRRYVTLWTSPLRGHERSWVGTIPRAYMRSGRTVLTLYLQLAVAQDHRFGRPWRTGSVLAERSWVISDVQAGSLFEVNWTSFSERTWAPSAVWRLEIDSSERFDRVSPEQAVTLHVNKDLVALRQLLTGAAKRSAKLAPIADLVERLVLAGFVVELLGHVLRWLNEMIERESLDLGDVEPESLVGKVLDAVKKLGLAPEVALEFAATDSGELTTAVQDHFRVGRKLSEQALTRMVQR